MLDTTRGYALQPLPFPYGHLALFAVLRHGLDLAPDFSHVFYLRLFVVVQLGTRLREAIRHLRPSPAGGRSVEVVQLALDGCKLLTEEELLLLLGE